MKLSDHFELEEFTRTAQPYMNVPAPNHIEALRLLCVEVLEPWRTVVGALHINSGFRSPAVNKAVGGASGSQHLIGEAADCKPLKMDLVSSWKHLVEMAGDLPVDQAIIYARAPGHGWIHVSRSMRRQPRRQLLVEIGGVFTPLYEWPADRPLVLS